MPGEIAEMMLNGDMCQVCGEWIGDGDGPGFALTCAGCGGDDWSDDAPARVRSLPRKAKKWGCSECSQKFQTRAASADHIFDKHAGPKPIRLKGAAK